MARKYLEDKKLSTSDEEKFDSYQKSLGALEKTMAYATENGKYINGAEDAIAEYIDWIREKLKSDDWNKIHGAKKRYKRKPSISTVKKHYAKDKRNFELFVDERYNGNIDNYLKSYAIQTDK